jgi:hypothetical protein
MSIVMNEMQSVSVAAACADSAADPVADQAPDLVALVDLKWLMYAYGGWIDVPRLCRDSAYAGTCLERALTMPSELVQRTARRVLQPLIGAH